MRRHLPAAAIALIAALVVYTATQAEGTHTPQTTTTPAATPPAVHVVTTVNTG